MIANALLEYETLDGTQVQDIVKLGKFTPPPPTPKVDPPIWRAGCDAAAGSAAKTRTAETARPWHARTGGGLRDLLLARTVASMTRKPKSFCGLSAAAHTSETPGASWVQKLCPKRRRARHDTAGPADRDTIP